MQSRILRLALIALSLLLFLPLPGWTMPLDGVVDRPLDQRAPGGGDYDIRGRIRSGGNDLPGITVNLYLSSDPGTVIQDTVTGSDGRYVLAGVDNGTYIVRPADNASYEFDPPQRTVIIFFGDAINQDFNAIFREYDVDGRIVEAGSGLANIVVRLYELPDTTNPVRSNLTDSQGRYLFADVEPGSYRVRPDNLDYTFVPPYRDFGVTNGPVTVADIDATMNTYSAGGHIDDDGAAMPGVSLALARTQDPGTVLQTVASNGGGNYVFIDVAPGTYRITPARENYLFVPDYRDIIVSGGDTFDVDFEANLNIFDISGRVTDNGAPLSQVQMLLTEPGNPNAVAVTVTDADGIYSFEGIAPGPYRVTPSRAGYGFEPPFRDLSVSNGDVNNIDFEANPLTYDASGRVADGSAGVPGVLVQLFRANEPEPIQEIVTAADGTFRFESLAPGEYRAVPVRHLVSFDPPERSFTIATGDVPNLFFEANTYTLYLPVSRRGSTIVPPTPTPTATAVPCRDEIEPNSLADADNNGDFGPGLCISGAIPPGDTNDFYRIQFPGGAFDSSLTRIPAGTNYELTLYRIEGSTAVLVEISQNTGTQDENIQVSNLAAGVYYIGVQSRSGNSPDPYRLIWSRTP